MNTPTPAAIEAVAGAAAPTFRLGEAPAYFTLKEGDVVSPDEATSNDIAPLLRDDAPPAPEAHTVPAVAAAPDDETRCLAAAVYYESRGEPLAGQMAVAQVVLNRAHSGRFANTICGVVRQPGQFAFAHRTFAPPASAAWTRAVAIARSAMAGAAEDEARGALFFHASYAGTGSGRIASMTIGKHVFYR